MNIETNYQITGKDATTDSVVEKPKEAFTPEVYNPLHVPGWNLLLENTPGATFFHTENWARVLMDTYGYRPLYFAVLGENRMTFLWPFMEVKSFITGRRGISLPFSDYCMPIFDDAIDQPHILESIIDYSRKLNWRFVEFRDNDGLAHFQSPSATHYRHRLLLENDDAKVFSRLRSNYRSKIRKAIKNNVEVRQLYTLDAIREYYRLHCITRKGHGLPPQPYAFFKNIYRHIIAPGQGFVNLAYHNDRAIAGAVYFHFGNQVIYKFGASDVKFQHLTGNYLVMWEAIRWSCQNGFQEFCFGKTDVNNNGLYQFKEGWGAQRQRLDYYRYYPKGSKPGYGFLKRFPIPLLRMTGNVLYRHFA